MPKMIEKEAKEINPSVMIVGEELDLKAVLAEVKTALAEIKSLREDIKNMKFMIQQQHQLRAR